MINGRKGQCLSLGQPDREKKDIRIKAILYATRNNIPRQPVW